jgi:drug/metabolite transporter (DMT)-like permease
MTVERTPEQRMNEPAHPPRWMTLAAFAVIYFVWGSTFYAIRVGVHEVPPLLFAALRFFTAGLLVFGWAIAFKERIPNARQWASAILLAFLMFVVSYGGLFWAEQRVPSGLAAVMLATIPAFMALSEIVILRTQRMTARLAIALLLGVAGVAVLMSRANLFAGAPIDTAGAVVLIVDAFSWSVASALARKLPLPASKAMSSGAQMLAGGVMLAIVSFARGEMASFDPRRVTGAVWIALLYLIFAGSILGFTAYIWLLHHQSPTKVGTYAYVNPVVAVILGYWLGGEPLGARTVIGAPCVLLSVIVITSMRGTQIGRGTSTQATASRAAAPATATKDAS